MTEMLEGRFLFADTVKDILGGIGDHIDHLVELVSEIVVLIRGVFWVDKIKRLNDIRVNFFIQHNFCILTQPIE